MSTQMESSTSRVQWSRDYLPGLAGVCRWMEMDHESSITSNTKSRNGLFPDDRWSLLPAISSGRTEDVRLYLEEGMNPNMRADPELLVAAIQNGYLEIVRLLLQYGAYANGIIANGAPLRAAQQENNQEMIRLLLCHGAHPTLASHISESNDIFYYETYPLWVTITRRSEVRRISSVGRRMNLFLGIVHKCFLTLSDGDARMLRNTGYRVIYEVLQNDPPTSAIRAISGLHVIEAMDHYLAEVNQSYYGCYEFYSILDDWHAILYGEERIIFQEYTKRSWYWNYNVFTTTNQTRLAKEQLSTRILGLVSAFLEVVHRSCFDEAQRPFERAGTNDQATNVRGGQIHSALSSLPQTTADSALEPISRVSSATPDLSVPTRSEATGSMADQLPGIITDTLPRSQALFITYA